jgi:hypothetical protein
MKKFVYVASITLLCCGFSVAQSTSDNSQSSQASQSQQGSSTQSTTPPGDRRDRSGDTVAPDGTVTPKGANTPGANGDTSTSQPSSMSTPDAQGDQKKAVPPGDRRDRYGDTVAPDGTVTPKGANTPGSTSNPPQPTPSTESAAPDAK